MQNTRVGTRPSSWGGFGSILEGPAGWIITLVILPVLVVLVLLLPPVNLLDRLETFTYTRISSTGGVITQADGTEINFPAEGVRSTFMATIEGTPRAEFIVGQTGRDLLTAVENLPEYLIPKSPFYDVELVGEEPAQAILSIPIPNDSLPYETLAVYGWNGDSWEHIPSTVLAGNDVIESRLDYVPESFMVMQTTPSVPAVTAELGPEENLPQDAVVTNETRTGLYLRGDGVLEGTAPVNNGNTLPVIRNWRDDVVRTDLINNLLIDPGLQENQLASVEQTVVQNGYPGVVIDYRGIDAVPSARADFVHLMTELADRLHANNKTLAVRVEAPKQISADSWETLGYDWPGLGSVVDRLIVPAPVDPRAYAPDGEMDALLRFATNQVERRKLQMEFPAQSVERSGNYLLLKGYQDALRPLVGQLGAQVTDSQELALTLQNPRIMSQVTWDESIGMYYYTYLDDQGFERTVYLETAGSISQKLQRLQRYNVRNVSFAVESDQGIDPALWNVLLQFQQGASLDGVPTQLSVVYNVYGSDDQVISQEVRPVDSPQVMVNAPESVERLRVDTAIINSAGQALGAPQTTQVALSTAQGSGESESEFQAGEEAGDETAGDDAGGDDTAGDDTANANEGEVSAQAAQAAPAPETQAAAAPEGPALTSEQIVNLREGPSTDYAILGQLNPGEYFRVTGKSPEGSWWQIDMDGQPAWIIDQLVSTSGEVNSIEVAENIPEPPEPAVAESQDEPAAESQDAPPAESPAVSAPAPTGGGNFGYGVQAHMVHNTQAGQVMEMTTGMGFNWVKQQVEWKVFESSQGNPDFGALDGIVNAANGAGVNLLFSVVNAPPWAREPGFDGSVGGPPEDPATFASFNRALAQKYCGTSLKAIEVWNEQNLHYEWGNKPLDPAEYVRLLAPSYAAIKEACPSMYVISGALTPAGSNPGKAVDDFEYLRGMFNAGVNNYMDGLGSHPSGYNVPPSVTWEGACEVIQTTGNSFNGPCDSPHHSWSFRSTMEGYRNIMVEYGAGNKKIWPTEFGWAAGGAFNPAYQYANDNSFEEQAEWTVEAYQMMRNWGWVGPAFLWNLNFRVVADGTEKAQWGIVDPSWQPLPVYNALRSMPK